MSNSSALSSSCCALILAAGKGTRMHSKKPKVLHTILGEPLLGHVAGALRPLFGEAVWAVIGHEADMVRAAFAGRDLRFVEQKEQLGTGHALMVALPELKRAGMKKVLVVNVASKCGLTPQYAQLEKLYEKYKDKDFVIIGFPANNFMGQEPGSNEEIAQFCSLNYDVTFPMMAKISVKGKEIAPLYQWLTEKKLNGKEDASVQWNFQKFMIDENGNWVGFASPKESPFSEKIVTWIEKE